LANLEKSSININVLQTKPSDILYYRPDLPPLKNGVFHMRKSIVLLISITLALTGCAGLPTPGEPTALPVEATTPPEPTIAPDEPTAVPTSLPPLVVLLSPDNADPRYVEAVTPLVSELAPANGFRWQVRPSLSAADFEFDDIRYVIALPPSEGVNELVLLAPDTQFLAVENPGLADAPNLIKVGGAAGSPDQQAFMGGYIGALITTDWRIGMITIEGENETNEFVAFENGMRFFCGLCRPLSPPFYEYPLLASLPADAPDSDWQAVGDFMVDRQVGAVYISPGAGGENLLRHLSQFNIGIIGGVQPPESISEKWIASIRADPLAAFVDFVPRLFTGEAGSEASLSMGLVDVNATLLSVGKQRLVTQILDDVQNGFISTLDISP
jgi:hypothetical protein